MMTEARNILAAAKAIQGDIARELGPPEEGLRSATQSVIPFSVVRNTRGYIERVVNQVNGTYENGWYDACTVMIRRLLETLIIEAFEHHGIAATIKNNTGEFFYLKDLIDKCVQESAWNLSRNCKRAMPKVKDIGDKSAHSRRYNAHRGDIDPLLADIRIVVQELVYLAKLK
jgi:Domain of unknown function (DUF4145)